MNIFITGGSSGLGRAIVEKLAICEENQIYFTYNRHSEDAESLVSAHPNVTMFKCDFTDKNSIAELLDQISSWNLDVLIHNAYAGSAQGKHFHKQAAEDYLIDFQNNILPIIQISQKVLETFRKKKSGKIITVLTSFLFNTPPTGYSLYSANKAYVRQLTKSWSKEYIKYGVTSNCISPSFMQTEFTSDTDERIIEQMCSEHPLKRLLMTSEVADCVDFLVNATSQLNGVNIPINAGVNII